MLHKDHGQMIQTLERELAVIGRGGANQRPIRLQGLKLTTPKPEV